MGPTGKEVRAGAFDGPSSTRILHFFPYNWIYSITSCIGECERTLAIRISSEQ